MKSLQVQAVITGIRAKVDRSLGISINTPELSTQEKALFFELQGLNSQLTITPLDEKAEGIETIDKELGGKSYSQRLRAVLFVLWKQEGEQGKFDDFYRLKMEQMIEHFKSKLE